MDEHKANGALETAEMGEDAYRAELPGDEDFSAWLDARAAAIISEMDALDALPF